MATLKQFLVRLGLLLSLYLLLYIFFPDLIGQAYEELGAVLGVFLVMLIFIAAWPHKPHMR